MNKNRTQNKSQSNKPLLVAIIALILAALSLLSVIYIGARITRNSDQQILQSFNHSLEYARLSFCYDKQIHPCTDDEIAHWNDKNPDEAFHIRGPLLEL